MSDVPETLSQMLEDAREAEFAMLAAAIIGKAEPNMRVVGSGGLRAKIQDALHGAGDRLVAGGHYNRTPYIEHPTIITLISITSP